MANSEDDGLDLMGTADVATFLSVSQRQVISMAHQLGGFRLTEGGEWRFHRRDVRAYVDGRRAAAGHPPLYQS